MITIEKKSETEKQIELAAASLAQIFIQQVLSRKSPNVKKEIDKYGKSN